jgi:hypothetical protein
MPENRIINYWILNKVYVIVAFITIIGFFIINYLLFIEFEIEISKELNTDCNNPIAIYFDKESRDRCLIEKNAKNKEFNIVNKSSDDNNKVLAKNVNNINKRIEETNNYYKSIENKKYPEIDNIQKMYPILEKIYNNINFSFENSQSKMEKIKTDFETTFENIVQNVIDIGNNLVNNLKLKVKVPKWDKRKPLVNGYEKIKKYLNNARVKPYLDKMKENPENLAKIQNIQNLPQDAKTGPKKK